MSEEIAQNPFEFLYFFGRCLVYISHYSDFFICFVLFCLFVCFFHASFIWCQKQWNHYPDIKKCHRKYIFFSALSVKQTVIDACLFRFGIGTVPQKMTSWVPCHLEYQNYGNRERRAGSSFWVKRKESFITFQSLMTMKDRQFQSWEVNTRYGSALFVN